MDERTNESLGVSTGHSLLRALFGTRAAGIAVVGADGRIELANQHLAELLHMRSEDLRGQPLEALLPGIWDLSGDGAERRLEAHVPGGWVVPVRVELSMLGSDRHAIVHVVDASDEIDAQRTRSQLEFWRATAHALDVPLAIVNRLGAIGWVNDAFCRLAGYSESELVGIPYFTFLEGEDALEQKRVLGQLLKGGGHSTAQRVHWRTVRGSPREITMRHLACADAEGSVRWIVLAGIDAGAFSG